MAAYAIPPRPAPFTAHTTLEARAPFDFARTLGFLGCFPPTEGEQQISPDALHKVVSIDGRAIACRITGTPRATTLAVELRADHAIDPSLCDRTTARLRFQLSLDDDLTPFYARAASDPAFSKVVAAQHGHHHVKFPLPFEIACWAVLGQRSPLRAARTIKDAIVARFGPEVSLDTGEARAFPEPAALAGQDARIASIVRDPRKASSLVAIARAFAEVDERFLREGAFEEVEAWLLALPRIGAWSSAFILFRGLGRMPRLALKEGPIFDAARQVYGTTRGRPLQDREIAAIADGYGEWCGYWALYLRARSR